VTAVNKHTDVRLIMDRQELVLTLLACADGRPYSPAQLQKAAFLISRNLPTLIDRGESFHFVPYDYGPFDADVYSEAESLRRTGDAVISPSASGRWNVYAASDAGLARGREILQHADEATRDYLQRTSEWVRSQSFNGLIKSIYEAYPDMRVNSIFRG
jgi:hypothetical protein